MAQVNIAYFIEIGAVQRQQFASLARDVTAKEVHGLTKSEIRPDSVSILVLSLDAAASISGADTEVQVCVSGNDWPVDNNGEPLDPVAAKIHFDALARRIYESLSGGGVGKLYIWVTPFIASGWAEPA